MASKLVSNVSLRHRRGRYAAVILAFTGLTAGCSVSAEESAEAPAAVETTMAALTSTTTSTSTSTTTSTLPVSTTEVAIETTDSTTNANPFGGNDPEDMLMPDVLCMNLQAAQDEIQDRGVFFSRSEDATGQGRRQILDSNWVVVKQTPAPGQPIGEFEALLSVVKIGESTGGVC